MIVHYHQSVEAARETLALLGDYGLATVCADLSDREAAEALANRVVAAWPQVNLLVNNAGAYRPSRFLDTDHREQLEVWQAMLQTNLLSAVSLSHAFCKHFRSLGGGKIINVASRAGERGEAGAAAYAASKAAMIALTKSLATELVRERIYVTAVAPGWTETAMGRPANQGHLAEILSSIPIGRMATVDEVAAAVAFLASADADYLTGITIDVNGASYLR